MVETSIGRVFSLTKLQRAKDLTMVSASDPERQISIALVLAIA